MVTSTGLTTGSAFARSSIAWSVSRQRRVVNLFVLHKATDHSLLPCVRPRFALSGTLIAGMAIENGRFYLEDNLSKFGTLVLAKGSIELEPEMTKAVQIGRSVISFTVKPYVPQPQ